MSDEQAHPWEQQEGEGDKAYQAFIIYRSLPASKRSLRAAAEQFYKERFKDSNVRTLEGWSSKWGWVLRARQFDAYQDKRHLAQDDEARLAMAERHIKEATAMQSVGLEGLRRIQTKMNQDAEYTISPGLAVQMVQQGAQMERLARGEPTEITSTLDTPTTWSQWLAAKREERGLDSEAPNPFMEASSNGGNSGNGNGTGPKD